ncbi:VTT domain-containing protein [Liquorilactobacillus satsumensis]|uniref:VTT domain-containing protein n=1 Tax=Liquorilactobacillus satsumensis TaxID=259059 RepID=UPI000705037E|nr:VTT domain-containing protein [Liquorilactobacillus satsumensis]MCC7666204.1 cytochrome O ubiquinol oxidase [Liquorilactobacillus satsumensis]MCP9313496.1 VTT domain-containing protein [Liquorilactobacillus satsumensis]MCP9329111.1 VTT domain-containing protein [Liquorilactobacillus satsumensis]MCP9357775.1 VTT domain-containing protein [Liquorilactobacillus satsumensis]MCP9360121.1 VTT domain-containing protein [Liquorilactobacillus satsumensis]
MISQFLFYLTHFHLYLLPLVETLGGWIYVTLFILIFMETGLVVFAFLPGESLIIFTSTLAALTGSTLDIRILVPVFFFAALIGDTVNYEIGRNLHRLPFFKRILPAEKLEKAHAYFEKHGGKTVMFGRFVPLIRTFIPLISGTAHMNYKKFCLYNLLGVLLWVALGASLGYFFGQFDFVKQNFSLIFIMLALIMAIPGIVITLYRMLRGNVSPS